MNSASPLYGLIRNIERFLQQARAYSNSIDYRMAFHPGRQLQGIWIEAQLSLLKWQRGNSAKSKCRIWANIF
jgi:hypothetical protein